MHRLILTILTCLSLVLPATASAWWQDDWNFRKQISVDTTPQGASINGAVGRSAVLVRLHTGNFSFDGVNENGSDIRFVSADDKTVFNHQIESFDPLMGIALIWVDLPQVEGGKRQDIWMYYGNQKAPAVTSQPVFDADYTLIYHFDGPVGSPPRDASAFANQAQTTVTGVFDGIIGRAVQLNGQQPLKLAASPSLAWADAATFTFSAWLRGEQAAGEQVLLERREGANSFLIGLQQGLPFVEVNGQRTQATQVLAAGQWQLLSVTADGGALRIYVNGREAGSVAMSLPAMNSALVIGGSAVESAAPAQPVEGSAPAVVDAAQPVTAEAQAAPVAMQGYVGGIDELRLSRVARSADQLLADAAAQGADARLLVFGVDEEQSGFSFGSLGFLLNAVPLDAWVIIVILALMMVQSWVIMYRKNKNVGRVSRANELFREHFAQVGTRLELLADNRELETRLTDSSLWRLYLSAVKEIRTRREQGADTTSISSVTIEAIRATMDGLRTRENQQLSSRLSTLSNAIAGGPYIGLLGTVLGIMVVFLGTAMAGDVNINAIAPGMAAALLATAMGLFVAIPALFGYNRLTTRNKEVSADMRVFVDEFVTRLAEVHGEGQASEAAHGRGQQASRAPLPV